MNMKLLIVLALVGVALSVAEPHTVKMESCSSGVSVAVLDEAAVDPWPLELGKNVTVTVTGTLSEDVTGGTITTTSFVFGTKFLTQSQDICTTVACPISKGAVKLSASQALPTVGGGFGTVPVQIQLTGEDSNHKALFCYKFDAEVKTLIERLD